MQYVEKEVLGLFFSNFVTKSKLNAIWILERMIDMFENVFIDEERGYGNFLDSQGGSHVLYSFTLFIFVFAIKTF